MTDDIKARLLDPEGREEIRARKGLGAPPWGLSLTKVLDHLIAALKVIDELQDLAVSTSDEGTSFYYKDAWEAEMREKQQPAAWLDAPDGPGWWWVIWFSEEPKLAWVTIDQWGDITAIIPHPKWPNWGEPFDPKAHKAKWLGPLTPPAPPGKEGE